MMAHVWKAEKPDLAAGIKTGTFPPEELIFEAASALDAAWDHAEHAAAP